MSVMSFCIKNIAARLSAQSARTLGASLAGKKALIGLLATLAFSTGCESPFLRKNEVSAGFHPGISMDLKQATLQVSGAQVVAGSSVGILLSLKDQNGGLWVKPNEQVSFAYSGGGSSGTLSSVVDNKDGTYAALLTGVRAGSPSQVTAVVNGVPLSSEPPRVTVLPGPASLDDSLIVVSASRVTAGSSVSLKFTITDRYGNPLGASHQGLSVGFDYSGSSQGTFSSVTDHLDGTYSATFTGTVAGDPSLFVAKVGGVSVGGHFPAPSVQVIASSPGSATLSVSSGLISSGSAATITLVSQDIYGNPAGSGRTVVFSAEGGTSTGTISQVTDAGGGTYTATFTGIRAGTETTIHAKIDGQEVTTTLPQIRVQAGAASAQRSVISASASTVLSGGSATLSLSLRDSNDNPVDQSGLAVGFSATGGTSTGVISTSAYQGSGVYSASFSGIKAGTPLIVGATLAGQAAGNGTSPTISVVPGVYSSALSVITVSAPSVLVNNSVTLTLTTKDANGNFLSSGGLAVAFGYTSGTSAGTIGPTQDLGNGVYTANFRGTGSGTAVFVTSSVSGVPILSSSPTLVVNPAVPSLALSSVSVSNSVVTSGATSTLALTVRDSAGNQIKDSALSVVFTRSGGTSTSTISSASYNSVSGLYSATFTGLLAGTATQISATIGGNGLSSAPPTITVVAGTFSLAQSSISVPTNTVASGSVLPVSVTIRDSNGNIVSDSSITVVISNQGGTSQGSFGPVTYAGAGVYSANFTATQAGTPTTLGATLGGGALAAGPQVTVIPGAFSLAQSVVSVSPASIASGQEAALELIAKDAFGNLLGVGGLTVTFGQSIAGMGQIGATVDHGNGTYTAPFTGVLAGGPDYISATLNGSAVTSSPPGIMVTPSSISLAQSLVSVSNSNIASGAQSTLKLTLKDAAGNTVKTSGLAVSFTQSGGTSTGNITAATYSADSGEYSAVFTGVLAGTATSIGATVGGVAVSSVAPSVTVVPGPLSLADSTVSVPAATVSAGSTVPVSIVPKDASGNTIINISYTIVFIFQGGTSQGTFGPVTHSGGTYTSYFTGTVAGTPTILGATIDGVPVTSQGPGVTVTVGALSLAHSSVSVSANSIASGESATVTLRPKDAQGNSVTSSGLIVAFTQAGGTSTGSFSSVNYNSATGVYEGTFTGLIAGSATSIGATIGGVGVTSALPSISVTAGALSLAHSLVTTSSPSVASGDTVTLTFTARDAAGNPLGAASDGLTVTFSATGGTSTGSMSAVSNSSSGVYTATFTGVGAGSALTIGANVGGSAVSSTLPQVEVVPGVFSLAQSTVSVSAGSVASGGQVVVTLTARDANQNPLTSGGLTVAFTQSIAGMGQFSSVTDGGNGQYSSTFTGIVAGGPDQLSATINGSSLTSASPGVTVTVGAASLANSTFSATPTSVTNGGTSVLSVTVRDANNNLKSGATVTFSISSGSGTGTFTSVSDGGSGTYSSTFTATGVGTAVIQASINGSALGTVSMSISSNVMSLEVPIEMIDTPLAAKTFATTFELSRTPLVTTYYDGSPQYFFEVVASNSDNSSRTAVLVDNAGTSKASITIPAQSITKRYKVSFTPNAGADQYRLRLAGATNKRLFAIYTSRILIKQTDATKTRLYVPLLGNVYSDITSSGDHWVDRNSNGTYNQSYPVRYNIWQKNLSNLETVPSGNAFQLDAVIWAKDSGTNNFWWDRYYNWDDESYSNGSNNDGDDDEDDTSRQNINSSQCTAGLINMQTGQEVSGSAMSTTAASPTLMSSSFANSAANFTDQGFFEVRIKRQGNSGQCYIGKAGLWVTLDPLVKGEVYYRVAKGYSWSVPSWSTDHSRFYLDLSLFSGSVSTYYETTGYGSNGSSLIFKLKDGGSDDSGSSGSSANCGAATSNLGNSRSRYRSAACTGLANGHRYYHEITSGSGHLYSGSSCLVVNFH